MILAIDEGDARVRMFKMLAEGQPPKTSTQHHHVRLFTLHRQILRGIRELASRLQIGGRSAPWQRSVCRASIFHAGEEKENRPLWSAHWRIGPSVSSHPLDDAR